MRLHVSPLEIINSATKINIIKHLMLHESAMSEREIASILKISHMSVNRALKELALYNLVSYSVAGKTHLWKLNRKSYAYAIADKFVRNTELLESPLENLKKTILNTLPLKFIENIILFGSVAKGMEEPNSDIDLFILVKNEKNKKKIQNAVGELSNKCLDEYGNRLEAYILDENEFKQKKDLSLLNEVRKGILIFPKN